MHHPTALLLLLGCTLGTVAAGPRVEMIGHRGASYDAPENTVASMRLAWEHGADAGELDIYLSKDGKLVVIHDKDTKRVAGVDLPVAGHTSDELRKLDVGKWKGAKFAGEKIPLLEEMLATIPAGKRIFVEIKPTDTKLVAVLDRVLRASGRKPAETPVISFHAPVIAAVKKLRPDLEAYWIVSLNSKKAKPPTAEELIAKAKKINADGLDLQATEVLDKAFADKVRAAGLKLYVWTVNDPAVARRMVELGVDGITTDRPRWLREQLAK